MLTRMNLLVSGAALLFACLAFVVYDVLSFRDHLVQSLSTQADIIGTNSASALLFNDPEAAARTLSALEHSPNIVSAQLLTPDHRRFTQYQRDPSAPAKEVPALPPGKDQAHWFEGTQVLLGRAIMFQGNRIGTVYIRSDLDEMKTHLRQYFTIAGVVLLLSMLAALLVSSIFRRAVAEPIVSLSELARVVSRDKDYSLRATPERSLGEVATLVDAFNEMLGQIQAQDRELRRAQEELENRVQARTAELTAANKELEAFSYSVSHDLRAPLRSIDGFSQALLEDYGEKLDTSGADYLRRIRFAAQRMSGLIDDLLTLARVTRSAVHRETVDCSTLAKSILEELQTGEPRRKVEFAIKEGLVVDADVRLLRVVLENLLGNAWKYTSRHDEARIEFGSTRDNGHRVYFVRDDGAGFDPQYASRLFGAFQRLHATTEFPGTGIGLATVQRIVHKHGGRIWAESAVEKGATFYFTLQ
jgi:signal transduction histidine kinase